MGREVYQWAFKGHIYERIHCILILH